jgi:hypothetical protein
MSNQDYMSLKTTFTNKITNKFNILALVIMVCLGYKIWSSYQFPQAPSTYELAMSNLGFDGSTKFSKETQEEALLTIFYLKGYFKTESLWNDINNIGKIHNPRKTFDAINQNLLSAGALQDDINQFIPQSLRKTFLDNSDLSIQDAQDLILYIAQNSFDRNINQERSEITLQNLRQNEATNQLLLKAVNELNLVDSINPKQQEEYDELWVAGASRSSLYIRLLYFNYIIHNQAIQIKGDKKILADNRELWANFDGINPLLYKILHEATNHNLNMDDIDYITNIPDDVAANNEGKKYMMQLAQKYNIKLNNEQPFIQCAPHECTSLRLPQRDYANYVDDKGMKLTESLMAEDILSTLFPQQKWTIVNSLADEGVRPNTWLTARDAARKLCEDIVAKKYGNKKTFTILFISNNPYVERQTLVAQQAMHQSLIDSGLDHQVYQIIIDGVGFASKQNTTIILSELAALIAEKWKMASSKSKNFDDINRRDLNSLLYQTRKAGGKRN